MTEDELEGLKGHYKDPERFTEEGMDKDPYNIFADIWALISALEQAWAVLDILQKNLNDLRTPRMEL